MQQEANAAHVESERLPLGTRPARDVARLATRFFEDRVHLDLARVLEILGGTLCGEERRAQELLELPVPRKLRVELLDTIGELRALTPDRFVARRRVVEDTVDHRALVTERPSS